MSLVMAGSAELERCGGRGEKAELVVLRWQASVFHLFRRAVGLRARVKALSGGWVPLGHLPGPRKLGERHEVRGQAPFLLTLFWPGGPGAQGSAQSQGRLALGQHLGSERLPAWPVPFYVHLLGYCGPRPPPASHSAYPSSLCLPKAAVSLLPIPGPLSPLSTPPPPPARPTFVFPAAPCEGKGKHQGV